MKTRRKRSFRFLVSLMLSLAMVFTTISPLLTVQAAVTVPVPTSLSSNLHPRVLFTANDVESIKAVVEGTIAERDDSENSSARAYFRRRADVRAEDNTDNGDPVNNSGWNEKKLAGIEAKALAYALKTNVHNTTIKKSGRDTGYEELGARAVQYLKKYLETIDIPGDSSDETNRSRAAGENLRVVAEVYDWCYDLFDTPIQEVALNPGAETPASGSTVTVTKAEIRSLVSSKLLPYIEMGSTFSKQGAVVGHGAEAQLLRDGLSWAIAVYGEDQSVWNNVAQRFYGEYVPARNEFLPTGWNLQGTEYGFYRNQWDAWAYMLITGMGGDAPYNSDAVQGLGEAALGMTYARRPDGQFFRDGDVPVTTDKYFSNWNKFSSAFMSAAVSPNPYSYGEYVETKPGSNFYEDTAVPVLVMSGRNNAALAKTAPKSTKNLPLTKFFGGAANIMFARTGWESGPDSNAAVAMMKIGGKFVDNHQHYDAGTFQLYYKGILASESGYYQGLGGTSDYSSNHHDKYYIKTVAHNGMLIGGSSQDTYFSVAEPTKVSDAKTVASLSSYAVDQTNPENPSFSYVKGDISQAYGGGVNYKRSFVFLNFKRADVPAAMIVYDYVGSNSAKTWLVHSVNKPAISGQQAVFNNTRSDDTGSYNGKMTVDTLLPASATLTAADGFKSGSSTYSASPANVVDQESNGARLEVSGKSSDHQFLNVMQVSDADKSNYLPVTKITGTNVVGAQIADKVVMFSANGGALTDSFSFTAPAGTYEYILTDVKRGAWQLNGGEYIGTTDDDDSNVLHFTKTLDSATTLTFTWNAFSGSGLTPSVRTMGERTKYDFFTVNATNKATGNPIATTYEGLTDENGMPLVEVDDLAAAMDASVSVVGDTATFTKAGKTVSFTLGSATMTRDGELLDKSTQATPVMFRDHMYVSPISIAAYFRAQFNLNKNEGAMEITANATDGDFVIEYSVDGVNYSPVPNFTIGTKQYDVELPYQTNVAYVRATNSLGTQYFSNTNETYDAQRAAGADDSFVWSSATVETQTQFAMERFLETKGGKSMDECATPIKNEYGTTKIYYTAAFGEDEDVFTIDFHAPQPKIVSASTNIGSGSSENLPPVYVGGAAAWNDNGTLIDSKQDGTVPASRASEFGFWSLGNISPSLQGASMFMLPYKEMIKTDKNTGSGASRTHMFKFSADAPGRVIVLMSKPAGGNSTYQTDYAWREGSHNGTGINGIKTGHNLTTKVSGAPNSDAQYYAMAYKWSDQGNYRTKVPGVIDSPLNVDGATTSQASKLLYSYYKDFNEFDEVTVPNPLNISKDGNGYYKSDNIVAVFVQYYDDPTPPVTGEGLQIQYYGKDGARHALNTNDAVNNSFEVTLPKNSLYAYLTFDAVDQSAIPTEVTYTWNPEGIGVDGERLIGTHLDNGSKVRIGGTSLAQVLVPVKALKEDASTFKVPIKNENSVAHIMYNGTEYTISFKAQQPRLTLFNNNGTNRIGDDDSTRGTDNCVSTVMFVGGAAANNDNGSIMKTNLPTTGYDDWWQVRTLSNICKNLEGASMVMLPRLKAKSNGVEYFSFIADTPGTIYVISDSGCQSGTIDTTNAKGNPWGKASGDNSIPKYNNETPSSDFYVYNFDRTYNNYPNSTEAFAYSISWLANSNTTLQHSVMDDSNQTLYPHSMNHFRTIEPGVYGTILSSDVGEPGAGYDYQSPPYIRQVKAMHRAYKCEFDAGERIYVYAFGQSDQSAVFIKWAEEEPVAGPLSMTFSSDDENFAHMKFDRDKTEYNVTLADNAKYAYVQFDVEDPTFIPENLFTTYDVDATGIDGSQLVGTVGQTGRKIDDQSLCQIAVPMEAQRSNSGAYKVPIKNENGKLTFDYDGISYTINFTAKQPRLTELTSYTADTSAEVLFVGGGAVNNDNGTITQTSRNAEEDIKGSTTHGVAIRTLTNVSNGLLGSSIFMMPDLTSGEGKLFTFTADHAGTVFVMSDTAIDGSGYIGAGTEWTCRNDGSVKEPNITGTTFPNSAYGYRNSNSYGSTPELQYYSRSTDWWTTPDSSSKDSALNQRRAYYNIGIIGNINSNGTEPRSGANGVYRGTWGMNYIYSLSFEAGQQVTIPGLWTSDSSADSAVCVIWDGDDMSGIGYEWNDDISTPAIDEDGNINIDASQLTSSGDKAEKLYVATYDENDRMVDIESGDSAVQTFHVGDEYDPAGDKTIGIFVNDLKVFRPSVTIKLKVSE